MEVEQLTHNVKRFRVALPSPDDEIGMITPGMLMVKAPGDPKPAMKPYTPITLNSTKGFFDLVVKVYPGGKVSGYVDTLKVGDTLEVKGCFTKIKGGMISNQCVHPRHTVRPGAGSNPC